MSDKVITVWDRLINQEWRFNHISDGYDDTEKTPTPKSPLFANQIASWKTGVWRKQRANLVNGVVCRATKGMP